MDPLAPFKIRPGSEPLEEAKRVFGPPYEVHMSTLSLSTELGWRIHGDGVCTDLTLTHREGCETLGISMRHSFSDSAWPGPTVVSFRDRLERFVESVRKPWGEWEEGEIMESPVWMTLHREDTGGSTPAIETRMVMLSFEKPEDPWVKRYFSVDVPLQSRRIQAQQER